VGTWQLFQESFNLATDAVPSGIEPLAVRTYLCELSGVTDVHDLHIWAMSTTETALTVHLVIPSGYPGDAFLAGIVKYLQSNFGIDHPTIQLETGDASYSCPLASEHCV
jgi:cobalt-zinc-cadmium efflux system protein